MRTVRLFEVFIASPSDTIEERRLIKETVHTWNAMNHDKDVVLEAITWESHAFPEMGDRPQAIINKQLIWRCDILVGVFKNRLGTQTGAADSGTAEEIQEFRNSNRPVLMYFSMMPVDPLSFDMEQYKRLENFKKQCMKQGLVWMYDSQASLQMQLLGHLTKTVELLESTFKNGTA